MKPGQNTFISTRHTDTAQPALDELLALIKKLRGRDGCPWDQRQTPAYIKKYLLEETQELAEAIDQDDPDAICEEIGDLFFILGMLITMFQEQHHFTAKTALQAIIAKMIRRHPHVFANQSCPDEQGLRRQWEAIKAAEKS